MADLKTPGVFVTETNAFGPSVVQVPTSEPAFLGCTANGPAPDAAGNIVPVVVRVETLSDFQSQCGEPYLTSFTVAADGAVTRVPPPFEYLLYDSLRMFFANGGHACYVVSVGRFGQVPTKAQFVAGLAALADVDGPTLILVTEAIGLPASDYYEVARAALAQCAQRRDRFAVLDVIDDRGVAEFRDNIGDQDLMWGAAYYPYLKTTLTYAYTDESVVLEARGETLADVRDVWLQSDIVGAISRNTITLPSSPAVAGLYAEADGDTGVWKAPVNVALSEVLGPTIPVGDADQGALTFDADGKSINAIRAFPVYGTLVWGARTLAGNDPQWKNVSVRRLMTMIEESVKAATAWAAFGPNAAITWSILTSMVESFLTRLWQAGAMAGATPADAFFVKVGLGSSMTQQDIADGRLVIELGVAAVDPAEFIVVRLTHQVASD
jgi:uncharacterized protein